MAGDGFGMSAEVVMGTAERVPGVGLTVLVADFLVEVEGLLAVGKGIQVTAGFESRQQPRGMPVVVPRT
jgi:hypothetical protein